MNSHVTHLACQRAPLAALGFRPVAHTILAAETLGWSESVAVNLRGRAFELLADADDGYFQVLLPPAGAAELSADLLRRLFAELDHRQHEIILIQPSRDWASLRFDMLATRARRPSAWMRPSSPSSRLEPRALPPHQIRALKWSCWISRRLARARYRAGWAGLPPRPAGALLPQPELLQHLLPNHRRRSHTSQLKPDGDHGEGQRR